MSDVFYDPIVAEVRRTREKILAEFGGDTKKLREHLTAQRPKLEAAGFHYETEEELQARLAWNRQQREELDRKLAAL